VRHRAHALTALCILAGCSKDDTGPSVQWDPGPLYGLANVDDDDSNGVPDGEEDLVEGENDLSALVLDPNIWAWAEDSTVMLSLSGDNIRVYRDGALLLEDGASNRIKAPDLIEVEFLTYLATGQLSLTVTDIDGATLKTVDIDVMSGPLILNHHLQATEEVVAMSFSDNMNLTSGFAEVLGDRFRGVSVRAYQYDVWVQDEIEFGTLTSPDHRVDMVIDSIRSGNGRGLDDLPENEFEAPDFARQTWGNERPSSQDSFGNLEVSPPVTVDGVTYPFGRIYWGEVRGDGPRDQALLDMLTAQQVQAPFQLDVSFLCVGHVDEFSTFLPDPTAPSGHRLYVTDTALAWEMLEGLDPDMSLPLYGSDKGYSTVQDILDDSVLRALNEEVQLDYLDPNVEIFKAELGLTDEDIVYLPMLFEEVRNCGGATAAFFPGTVNMQVSTLPGESTTHVFMPDPFFRSDTSISAAALATDPLIAFVEALLPANVEPHWLDDWDWYHLALGEVHCGSNTVRTPAEAPWWESAMHLIGGDQ
jgi:protein-arginine deiminase